MSAQSKAKSKLFHSWPSFVQETLWHADTADFESWRSLPIGERLEIADRLKHEGNELYRAGKHEDAVDKYARAAGLFHYVQQTGNNPGGHGSIDDAYLRLVTVEGETSVCALRATCYSNIAQCILRQAKPDCRAARRACDEALLLDPANAKALYRRALACEGLGEQGALEAALGDLARADALGAGRAAVESARRRISAELQQRPRAARRMYGGFLRRAQLGGACERERAAAAERQAAAARAASGADIRQQLEDASRLREACLVQGREDDARDAERAVAACRARLEEREGRELDVFRPSEPQRREARSFGIDLDDLEARRRLDRVMWDVHRATELEEWDEREPSRPAGRRAAIARFWDAVYLAVASTALLWVLLVLRWRQRGAP